MKKLNRTFFIGVATIWLFPLVILTSFHLGIADFYNEKRIIELAVLLFGSISFIWLLTNHQLNICKKGANFFGLLAVFFTCSILFSESPNWSILEIGWYICLLQLALVAGYIYQQYSKKFEQVLFAAIIGMAVIYTIRVSGDLITAYFNEGWPNWPNHRRMFILYQGENIAQNGFLNFQNVRFFNHLQTWSLPLLVYPYLHYSKFLVKGYRISLGVLISFWWMLVFASGARGTLLATIISVAIIYFLFKKESWNWIKVCLFTLIWGLLLYFFVFHLLLSEGSGKAIARPGSSGRMALWWETWQIIKENPIFGIGPMQMANVQLENPITSPHNIYLMWMAEWGIPAFVVAAFLGIKGVILWFKEALKKPSNKAITISIVILAGIIHSGVSGLLITPLSQLLFVVILGWTVGSYYDRKNQELFTKNYAPSKLRYVFIAGILSLNIFVFAFVGCQIPFLEERTENFEDMRREGQITLFLDKKWGMFPRFWEQGFVGMENVDDQ